MIDVGMFFGKDFVKQCQDWEKGERLFIVMDRNKNIPEESLTSILAAKRIEMKEFSHDFLEEKPPDSF